ncbi:MAG: helix-turn-helix transcriptional regulator [Eubacteriales bacterium]|nr:helix-turn-helix transcriptional regulator [Eubacteriales bacterium]
MLCDKIKELRKSHGKSQVEIANELSVTKQTVSNWENNNIQPSVDMLVKIADYFGVSTDYLLERNEKNTLCVDGLSMMEIAHIEQLIKDLAKK